jgi:hypothetical protein
MSSCRSERKTGIRLGDPDALPQCVANSSGASSMFTAGKATSTARALRAGASATRRLGRLSELAGTAPSRTSQQRAAASMGLGECSSASGQQQIVSRSPSIRQKNMPPLAPVASKARISNSSGASSFFIQGPVYAAAELPSPRAAEARASNLDTGEGLAGARPLRTCRRREQQNDSCHRRAHHPYCLGSFTSRAVLTSVSARNPVRSLFLAGANTV